MTDKNYKLLLGQNIKKLRNSQKLTQEAFCNEINLEISNLSNIENGKCFPSLQTLFKIITKFKIEPNELFNLSFYDNEKIVDQLISEHLEKLPFEKKVLVMKIIVLINEEDKS